MAHFVDLPVGSPPEDLLVDEPLIVDDGGGGLEWLH